MKRYYICDLIGTGALPQTADDPGDPFRASVPDGVNSVAVFPPQDMNTGQYTGTRVLAMVAATDHVSVQLDLRNRAMPDYPLDVKISAMDAATRTAWETMLTTNGFAVNWSTSDGYRVAIRNIGRQLDPNFHEDNFDVAE